MVVSTKINLTQPLFVLKSLNPLSPCWFINENGFSEDFNRSEIFQINFGGIVFGLLNHINKLKDFAKLFEDEEQLTRSQKIMQIRNNSISLDRSEIIKKLEENSTCQTDSDLGYYVYSKKLLELIENKEKSSKEELLNSYNSFKDLAACIMYCQSFSNKTDPTAFPSNNDPIRTIGYEIVQGNLCEVITINGYDDLFALDLFELFFNHNTKICVKKCRLCGDFFVDQNKKIAYCGDCGAIKDKVNNDRNRKKEKYKLKKSILEKIERNRKFEFNSRTKRDEFFTEYNYYCDIVKNGTSQIKRLDTYKDIKTEAELLDWLKDYEDSVRAHPKKQK